MPDTTGKDSRPMRFPSASGSNIPPRLPRHAASRKREDYSAPRPVLGRARRRAGPRISSTTSHAAPPPPRRCARPRPRRWPTSSARPSDSKRERPPPTTSSCIAEIRNCCWRVSTIFVLPPAGFWTESLKCRACPKYGQRSLGDEGGADKQLTQPIFDEIAVLDRTSLGVIDLLNGLNNSARRRPRSIGVDGNHLSTLLWRVI